MYMNCGYNRYMIKSFADSERKIIMMDNAQTLQDLRVPMKIETPTIGEILVDEFLEPYGISAYRLAKDIDVPVSRIQDIIKGRRRISADTSIRLGKYFGVSEKFFLDMQNDIDIRELKQKKGLFKNVKVLSKIAVL